MADPLLRLIAHPLAVAAHVLGQPGGPRPVSEPRLRCTGEHRRPAGELRRDLNESLVDQHRDRVEVGGVRLKPQPLGLERDRSTASERVEHRRWIAAGVAQDLLVGPGEELLVTGVLPDHKLLDQLVQPVALRDNPGLAGVVVLDRQCLRPARRVVDQLGEQHRPGSGQRLTGPPEMQRRRVAVPDRLLPGGLGVDLLQGERDLDQLAAGDCRHSGTS
ncbi:hypothetical protein QOZ86_17735 [Blastococcus capsensis]|nr:hypothetical protein [Blastococcus capsensis]MDK3258350.1 hypothetical protein [Blastococcus capsensis]